MNIIISPDTEKRIRKLLERGEYPSADLLVQEALDSFLDVQGEENPETIRRRIGESEAEIDRGEFVDYDATDVTDLAKDVHQRGQARLAQLRKSNARG